MKTNTVFDDLTFEEGCDLIDTYYESRLKNTEYKYSRDYKNLAIYHYQNVINRDEVISDLKQTIERLRIAIVILSTLFVAAYLIVK